MTRDEFDQKIAAQVASLWPSFAKRWTDANKTVTFKLLSHFRLDQVDLALENHRFDDPDARAPVFKTIVGRLWQTRRERESWNPSEQSESIPEWSWLKAWADAKSDDDLNHLWSIAASRHQDAANAPTEGGGKKAFWPFVESCERRSEPCLVLCYAAERDIPLTFNRGSAEWWSVQNEYDRRQRRKAIDEYGHRRSAAIKQQHQMVAAPEVGYVLSPPASATAVAEWKTPETPDDDIPF